MRVSGKERRSVRDRGVEGMSEGLKLLSLIVENASGSLLRDIPADLYIEDEVEVYRFIRTHYRRYGVIPALSTVEETLDITLPEAEETPEYYRKKLFDRKLYASVRTHYTQLQNCLREFDMDTAREVIRGMRADARIANTESDVRNFTEAAADVLARYDFTHSRPGLSGVPTMWPRYDAITGGYQPGDVITYVARPEMGKTTTMLRHAVAAYRTGYSVLIVSMEMPIEQMMRRVLGLLTGIDPNLIKRGQLSTYARRRLGQYVQDIAGADRLRLYSGGMSKHVSDVDILVQEFQPDIIYVDGVYLMSCENRNVRTKTERVSEVFDEVKQLALARNKPVAVTTQYNRVAGRKGKDGALENIAYSDAIATHSSIILSIQEGLPGRERETRIAELIKGREGETGSFPYNYLFRPVNLDEIEEETQATIASAGGPVGSLDWTA